jgi:large subunit ribosomal protein L18
MKKNISQKKSFRKQRVHKKMQVLANRPRLTVFRSLKHISAQIIDDEEGKVIVFATSLKLKPLKKKRNKIEIAAEIGKLIAKRSQEKNIKKIVFDRSGYKYHGRVKALAEAARKEGLIF